MQYNLDSEISRRDTASAKWDFRQDPDNHSKLKQTSSFSGEERILPLWVADMDFACAQPIIDALTARAQHGIFGYTIPTPPYRQAVADWMQRRHNWQIDPASIVNTPGVVSAIDLLLRTFVKPDQNVIIQPPVYYPFFATIEHYGAQIAANPLTYQNGRYQMDFADLEAQVRDPQTTMAILCHPHNPVGRVWTPQELTRFADICRANDVLIVSDEIHGDFTYKDIDFRPLASLSDDLNSSIITCTGASKTFNLAGLHLSNIIVPDEEQRQRLKQTVMGSGLIASSVFGVVAIEAAYTHGEEWLDQVLAYIEDNLHFVQDYLAEHLPQITLVPPEGTYLLWLDCRALELDKDELHHLMFDKARVYLEGRSHLWLAG